MSAARPLRRFGAAYALGSILGLMGASLLFLENSCRSIESSLLEEFRIIAFLKPDLDEGRRLIVEEKLGALPDVAQTRFVSPQQSLDALKKEDPDLAESLALVGENPLPGAFEVRLDPEAVSRVSQWVLEAYGLTELADIRYQPVLVQAILQVQFYSRFLALVRGAALSLGVALLLGSMWLSGPKRAESGAGESSSEAAGVSWAVSAVGLAMGLFSGAGLSYLLISPIRQLSGLH